MKKEHTWIYWLMAFMMFMFTLVMSCSYVFAEETTLASNNVYNRISTVNFSRYVKYGNNYSGYGRYDATLEMDVSIDNYSACIVHFTDNIEDEIEKIKIYLVSNEPFSVNAEMSVMFTNIKNATNVGWEDSVEPTITTYDGLDAALYSDGLYYVGWHCPNGYDYFFDAPHIALAYGLSDTLSDERICTEYVGPAFMDGTLNSFFEDVADYDETLGYVKDVELTTAYLKVWDEFLNGFKKAENQDGELRIKWDSISTSGFDLTSANTFVRVFTTPWVHYTKDNEWYTDTMQLYEVGQSENSSLYFRVPLADFWSASQDAYDSLYEKVGTWDFMTRGGVRVDEISLQIIHQNEDGSWAYGGYLQIREDVNTGKFITKCVKPSGGIDDSSNAGGEQTVEKNETTGTTFEDAYDDLDSSSSSGGSVGTGSLSDFVTNGGIEELSSELDNLISLIGKWPAIIHEVFSFLPSWCVNFFGFSIAIACIVMLWKVLRG